jgi:hypothetical protein
LARVLNGLNNMRAFAGCLAFVVLAAVPSAYRIDLKGGGGYWANARPTEQSGRYVFRTTGGTLMSIRKSDVARIGREVAVSAPADVNLAGHASPAAAARNQKVYAGRLHVMRKTDVKPPLPQQDPYFRQSPYRPGVGEAFPPSANDYTVGKTFAYPPSGKVYEGLPPNRPAEGLPPNKAPEGPAPMVQTPPPPPPPQR